MIYEWSWNQVREGKRLHLNTEQSINHPQCEITYKIKYPQKLSSSVRRTQQTSVFQPLFDFLFEYTVPVLGPNVKTKTCTWNIHLKKKKKAVTLCINGKNSKLPDQIVHDRPGTQMLCASVDGSNQELSRGCNKIHSLSIVLAFCASVLGHRILFIIPGCGNLLPFIRK